MINAEYQDITPYDRDVLFWLVETFRDKRPPGGLLEIRSTDQHRDAIVRFRNVDRRPDDEIRKGLRLALRRLKEKGYLSTIEESVSKYSTNIEFSLEPKALDAYGLAHKEPEVIKEAISTIKASLAILREQQAKVGLDASLKLLNEIRDLEAELEKLERWLAEGEDSE